MSNDTLDLCKLVTKDVTKNYQGRGYDCAFVHEMTNKYIELGLPHFRDGNVLITYNVLPGQVEFHCMNGGTGADLTTAINVFLTKLSETIDRAVTYYDNPRINELVKYSKYPAEIRRIDGGEDRTFEMSFDLRGS